MNKVLYVKHVNIVHIHRICFSHTIGVHGMGKK